MEQVGVYVNLDHLGNSKLDTRRATEAHCLHRDV